MTLSAKPQLPLYSRGSQNGCHEESFSHFSRATWRRSPKKELLLVFLVGRWQKSNWSGETQGFNLYYKFFFSSDVVILNEAPRLTWPCSSVTQVLYNAFSPLYSIYDNHETKEQVISVIVIANLPDLGSPLGWVACVGDYLLRFNQQMLWEPGTYLTSGSAVAACSGNLPFLSGMFCLAPFLSRLMQPSSQP